MSLNYIAKPTTSEVSGHIKVPGDKSISHRSIMFGSLAEGTTTVTGFLQGEDSLNTLKAFQAMGVNIEGPDALGNLTITGVGMHGLQPPTQDLYMGNSGTAMRLLSGVLAAQNFDSTLTGDVSLSKRPMKRITEPLTLMGAKIATAESGRPPLKISGGQALKGIHYPLPMASAQVKSCLLLAGLYAQGETTISEPAPTRDHTERMLQGFGYTVEKNAETIILQGGGKLSACHVAVPSDISSAAFFMVAAAIATSGEITLEKVGMNPTRTGIIDILKLMRADITVTNEHTTGGEPVADITIKASKLQGIEIPEALVPLAIDEFPVLFVAAACAEGTTILTGAEELRVKESDRIQAMADGLQTLGINARPTPDGMIIEGGNIGGGSIESHHDHRIAMSFAVASLRASHDIQILGAETVNTSFPGFLELANRVGFNLTEQET